jgi:hypothetical protein
MQIERLNYLVFPPDTKSLAGAKDAATSTSSGTSAAPQPPGTSRSAGASVRQSIPVLIERAEDALPPSTILVIGTPDTKPKDIANTAAPVYSREGKTGAPPARPNLEAMAQAHQRAQERANERSSLAVPQLKLDKDGVVVARSPASQSVDASSSSGSAFSQIHPQGDFVSLAVSAMREFKDETERQNRYAPAPAPLPPEVSSGPLRSLQQLASRFNLFA